MELVYQLEISFNNKEAALKSLVSVAHFQSLQVVIVEKISWLERVGFRKDGLTQILKDKRLSIITKDLANLVRISKIHWHHQNIIFLVFEKISKEEIRLNLLQSKSQADFEKRLETNLLVAVEPIDDDFNFFANKDKFIKAKEFANMIFKEKKKVIKL